jgi:type VI secretion system protein ImpH
MATAERRAAPPVDAALPPAVDPESVLGRLFREAYRFDFFQAVWLLEMLFADAPSPGEPADIKRVAWTDDGRARMTLTFMGLYGVDASLPAAFHEHLFVEPEGAEAHRDFLDLFNHRLYALFYRCWKLYRPGLDGRTGGHQGHGPAFLSLAGLGTPGALRDVDLPPLRLAAFAGRLGAVARNAEGLRVLLEDLLEGVPVQVEEFVPRWVPLPAPATVGTRSPSPAALGCGQTLGRRIYDVAGKIRLVLGPLALPQFQALLPGGAAARRVHQFVRLYAADYLDYDVELRLDASTLPRQRLGDHGARLGKTAWIGQPRGQVVSEVVAYE